MNNLKQLLDRGLNNFQKNKLDDAKLIFEDVLKIDKKNFDALQGLGIIEAQKKNYLDASNFFYEAIKFKPNDFNINCNLGNSLVELGKFEDSIFYYDIALKINGQHSPTWCFKGIALKNLQRYEEAEDCLQKSIELDHNYEKSYFHLGSLYRTLRKYQNGLEIFHKALKVFKSPLILEVIYTNLSNLHLDINDSQFGEDYSLVDKYSKMALLINSKNYIALNNLAMSNLFKKKYELASEQLENVVKINNQFAPAHRNLGTLHNHLGNHNQAEIYLKNSLSLDPTDVSKNFLLSEVLLAQNKFSEAWFYYEYRWIDVGGVEPKVKPNFTKPVWNSSKGYKTRLAIWAEQGLGDMILFSSILPELVKKFDKIYLLIDKRLCQILNESIPGINAIDFSKPITEDFFDYQLPLCSLGLHFRNDVDSFNVQKPLLKVIDKKQFNKKKKFRCGISWQSKGGLKSDKKNIGIEALQEIFKINDIEFFDIQYTKDNQDTIRFKEDNKIDFEKPKDLDIFNDIYGLFNFIDSCDFIISTSNTNAHLAASLGKPTFLLLPKEYGRLWYWDNDENGKNLWYPTIKKFNQIKQGDWTHPIRELSNFLEKNYKSD
jgi:tetratricopeptide (TPR) repeat protein